MLKIVQNLLRFARKYQPEKSPVDLNLVVRSTLELKAYEMKVDNIRIVEDITEDLPFIVGDANQLQQVFLNILNNAHQAMMEIRHQRLLRVSTRQKDGLVRVSIEDSGPGIPKSIMSRIFDPFFTTKPLGQGTGLGLSVSFGIIKEHRGSIRAESEPGRGATFIMDLPVPEE
jgi:two-component system NtrC family sensor kinase